MRGRKRRSRARLLSVVRSVFLLVVIIFSQAPVGAAIDADTFCGGYSGEERIACNDGVRGASCQDYAVFSTQRIADICNSARSAKQSGAITGTPSFSPSTGSDTGGTGNDPSSLLGGSNPLSSAGGLNQLGGMDQLSQMGQMTQYIDQLHQNGSDAKSDPSLASDNNYGSYANSAGEQQAVTVIPSGQQNGPGIVYFASQDGSGDSNAAQQLASGAEGAVGGGATARGYTVIIVSTRSGTGGANFQYEDAVRGIRHIIQNASQYGVDPTRVALMGDSDGGAMALRAGSSGQSGAKAVVGWSAASNAFTSMFQNDQTFQQGASQLPCLNQPDPGAEQQDAFGQSNTDAAAPSSGDLGALSQVLSLAQFGSNTSQSPEAISQQMGSGNSGLNGLTGLGGSSINMPAKTFVSCFSDMLSQSPSLAASPETPPTFLAGFDNDELLNPQQLYDMRDKISGMGITTDTLIIPGDPAAQAKPGCSKPNHLCYDSRFVCKTLNFLDSQVQKDKQAIDCETGKDPNAASAPTGGDSGNGGDNGNGNGGNSGGSQDDGCGPNAHMTSSGCACGPAGCDGSGGNDCDQSAGARQFCNSAALGLANCTKDAACRACMASGQSCGFTSDPRTGEILNVTPPKAPFQPGIGAFTPPGRIK